MAGTNDQGTVVCGVDGSSESRAALAEALRLASRTGARLRVVRVFPSPETWSAWGYGPAAGVPLPPIEGIRDVEERDVHAMVRSVQEDLAPALDPVPAVTAVARAGQAVDVLVEESEGAAALVVGHRGRGAVGSVLMGSTSLGCVLHAACPVTVVPVPVAA